MYETIFPMDPVEVPYETSFLRNYKKDLTVYPSEDPF